MFNEDNSGFVNFPITNQNIACLDTGKTLVYIVVFDTNLKFNKNSRLENINLFSPGIFVSDDITSRPSTNINVDFENLIKSQKQQVEYDNFYFPYSESPDDTKKDMSINLISAICIGWSNNSFESRDNLHFWNATFKDLTIDGKNLYYCIKKLHNSKEVRILTFNLD